jgi:excisionase family DNA binding protein
MTGLLRAEGVAELLGCSTRSVHELTRKRAIPCRRIAGTRRILFREDELAAWVDAGGDLDLDVSERGGGLVVKPKAGVPA